MTAVVSTATSTIVYISIPEGRRIRGKVKEFEPPVDSTAHPKGKHIWREMLHFGQPGTGFAECICGAMGVPYRKPRA